MVLKDLDPKKIYDHILQDGYYIAKSAVNENVIDRLRDYWLNYLKPKNIIKKFVRGRLVFGEKNFLSFSNTKDWTLFRNFDFLWNKQTHDETTNLCIDLHKIRNKAQNFDPNYGINLNEQCYGIYIATSLYPPKIGHLLLHEDSHLDVPILHFMLPLTFKNKDYDEGGLTIIDKKNKKIDVDSICTKGDVIFFDQNCKHGVETIHGGSVGRLAVFAIPTFFKKPHSIDVFLRSAQINLKEFKDKFKNMFN